jgi:hypothetical protein
LAQNHLDKGDEVEIITCNGILPICEVNPNKSITTCLRCISRRNQGLALLSSKVKTISLQSFYKKENRIAAKFLQTKFNSLTELKSYKIGRFKIGAGVYSSILDLAKNHEPNLTKYKGEISDFILTSYLIYCTFYDYLKSSGSSRVYLFNGRHATGKPIIAACNLKVVDFYTYEFHYYKDKYKLYKNTQPHDFLYELSKSNEYWSDPKVEQKVKDKIGAEFYKRKNISEFLSRDILKLQQKTLLPKDWDKNRHNVIFFTNSEFESYAAFEYKEESVYKNHFSGICDILESLKKLDHDIHIYIRLHPYLASVPEAKSEIKQYQTLEYDFMTLIQPDDPVDSYELIKRAGKVISYISTISMESSYMNKPTILLSKHLTAFMGSCYVPETHEEVLKLILDQNLNAKDREGALKFGYFWERFGESYKYYHNQRLESGYFKDIKVEVSPFIEDIILRNYHRPKLRKFRIFLENLLHKFCIIYITGKTTFKRS